MEDPEERGAINDQKGVGAHATPAECDETADDFRSVNVAGFVSITGGKTACDWCAERERGIVIVFVLAKGANLGRVCAAVERVFAAVTDENSVLIKVRRCGAVQESRAPVVGGIEGVDPAGGGPIFGRRGDRMRRGLENGEFAEPVSVGSHAGKTNCFLQFGGCNAG